MKVNWSKIRNIALCGFTLTTLGLAIWLGTSYIIQVLDKKNENVTLNPNNKEIISLKKSLDVPVELIEHETSDYFFLGDEGLKILNQKIINELEFGPEIEMLKSIRINNLNILSKNVSGQYNPFTHEMEISISSYLNDFKNIPPAEKVELIWPTIYHEYGHHFANTYITSIATDDPRNSKKLFAPYRNESIHKNIPSSFLNVFEDSLHYSDTPLNRLLSSSKNDVSSFKTARDFYLESNNENIWASNTDDDYLKINNQKFKTRIPFRNSIEQFSIDSNKYTYFFSIDELLTRKLQQISYVDTLNGKAIANNSTTFTGTITSNSAYASTMATDISKNKQIEYINNNNYRVTDKLILMDYPYGGTFISEGGQSNIIPSTVRELWKAYFDIAGSDFGISQIYLNNNSVQVSETRRSVIKPDHFNQIKITGFLEKSPTKNYKGLVTTNKQNGQIEKWLFIKNNYYYKWLTAKEDILSPTKNINKPMTKFGYSTNYIPVDKLDFNKPIQAWNDKNNNDVVESDEQESLTVSTTRPTSTFRESFSKTFINGKIEQDADIRNNKFYEVISKGNDAYLQIYNVLPPKSPLLIMSNIDSRIGDFINIPKGTIMINIDQNKRKY